MLGAAQRTTAVRDALPLWIVRDTFLLCEMQCSPSKSIAVYAHTPATDMKKLSTNKTITVSRSESKDSCILHKSILSSSSTIFFVSIWNCFVRCKNNWVTYTKVGIDKPLNGDGKIENIQQKV